MAFSLAFLAKNDEALSLIPDLEHQEFSKEIIAALFGSGCLDLN